MIRYFIKENGCPIQVSDDTPSIKTENWTEINKSEYDSIINQLSIRFENKDQIRIIEIKDRLVKLTEDFMQAAVGEIVPNISDKKAEFINLHNELRILEGKEPRKIKDEFNI